MQISIYEEKPKYRDKADTELKFMYGENYIDTQDTTVFYILLGIFNGGI